MSRIYTEQEQVRREARVRMEEEGVNPYAYSWDVSHHATDVLAAFDEEKHVADGEGRPRKN